MLKVVVEPGQIYYVEGTVTTGVFVGQANIAPSNEADFISAAHKLKLVQPAASDAASGANPAGG